MGDELRRHRVSLTGSERCLMCVCLCNLYNCRFFVFCRHGKQLIFIENILYFFLQLAAATCSQ